MLRVDPVAPGPLTVIGPFPTAAFSDNLAPDEALVCYVVTPLLQGQVLGFSDLECGMRGLTSGSLQTYNYRLFLNQSNLARLVWCSPSDVSLLAIIALDGRAPEQITLLAPPFPSYTYVHDTGGVATCYVVVSVRLQPSFEYGMTDMVCGFPGVSSLSGLGSPEVRKGEEVADRLRLALADLKLPELAGALAEARGALAGAE